MIAVGGIIGRIRRGQVDEPAAIAEFLELDGAIPVWTVNRLDALFFPVFTDADDRARRLHCFAITATPPAHRRQCEPELEAVAAPAGAPDPDRIPPHARPLHRREVDTAAAERRRAHAAGRKRLALIRQLVQREDDYRELERIETE